MGEDREQVEVLLEGLLGARPTSGIHHFLPFSTARAQSQLSLTCVRTHLNAREAESPHESKSKRY